MRFRPCARRDGTPVAEHALIPDPGLTFDEALVLDAVLKLAGDIDARFHGDAVVNAARMKIWESAMAAHRKDPKAYEAARERFAMHRRMIGDEPG
jgi:hypothetical protein